MRWILKGGIDATQPVDRKSLPQKITIPRAVTSRMRLFELFPRLDERRGNGGNQLSGGEQQMLAIARALMGNPRLLLMDEPLEGLAPGIVDQIVSVIHRIRSESDMAILTVEQHVDIALEFSQSVIVLDRGMSVYNSAASGLPPDRATIEGLVSVGG